MRTIVGYQLNEQLYQLWFMGDRDLLPSLANGLQDRSSNADHESDPQYR